MDVAGRSILAAAYNGSYVPPTLRVHPGDVVQLRLVNALDDATNLHTHGLSVSQLGNSDNVFLHVPPGGAQDYEIRIPSNHARGLYWYHPHSHGHSDDQVRNGMSGALIVEGLLDPFPELRDVHEHVLLLKDAQVGGSLSAGRYASASFHRCTTCRSRSPTARQPTRPRTARALAGHCCSRPGAGVPTRGPVGSTPGHGRQPDPCVEQPHARIT